MAAGTGMGFHTFFAQAFLTAMFNVRLGYWMANPKKNTGDTWVFWPRYMWREVFGTATEHTNLVHLSDGGHTGDNVGIYPLFQRRCRVIIACDAEADADADRANGDTNIRTAKSASTAHRVAVAAST